MADQPDKPAEVASKVLRRVQVSKVNLHCTMLIVCISETDTIPTR